MKILEIGCGIGGMTEYLAQVFGEVYGVDVSGEMIRIAKNRLQQVSNVWLKEGSGKDLAEYNDGIFDFVFSFIVFQHIPCRQVILDYIGEAHRVLKPGGIFKFQLQGCTNPEWLSMEKDTWHGETITDENIDELRLKHEFEIVEKHGQGTQYSFYTLKKSEKKQFPTVCSIVIPVYNKLDFTRRCIEYILKNTNSILYELVIVDNGSTDGTTTYLKSLPYPFKIIYNNTNLGFSQACNQGIRAATSPYILFLNNDTEPQPGWLEPLIETLDNDPTVAAVGSKLLFPDRTIQHAGVVIALQEASGQICPFHIFYKETGSLAAANRVMEFAVCTGACLMVRAERLRELGGFDENFWNGYEDVDLCLRLCQGGWRVVYQPKSVLIHHESQSGPERFSRQNQNVELLQRKWRNRVSADILIKPDGKIIPQKSTQIRPYPADRQANQSHRAQEPPAEKRLPLPCISELTSIVILTFNQLKFTKECVKSIRKHTSDAA